MQCHNHYALKILLNQCCIKERIFNSFEGQKLLSFKSANLKSLQILCCMNYVCVCTGLSLWGCVASNVIGSLSGRHLTLLQSYHLLSLPAHSLYLLLLSLVSLSLLDRFVHTIVVSTVFIMVLSVCSVVVRRLDLARVGRQCWQFSLRSLPGLAVLAGRTPPTPPYYSPTSLPPSLPPSLSLSLHSRCTHRSGINTHSESSCH